MGFDNYSSTLLRSLFGTRAFSVIVSRWSAPDAPIADLMIEFYRQWCSGLDKAQVLRQARLATMETYPEPNNWAAFTLIGEAE
ncbi:MAG: CHAT domain-containing protein [Leptolyngbyaceae cyanobacterium MO_188.B28]|nr:CHAT domain-containing protein [Leptolyngbyaceae cyanobacterium MO_188.B28]